MNYIAIEHYMQNHPPPDIWLIQETFLKGPPSPAPTYNYYNIYQGPYAVMNEDRMGLLTLIHYKIKAKNITPTEANKYFTAIQCENIETGPGKRTTVIVINTYLPNIEGREKAFTQLITFIQACNKPSKQYQIIIGGDFNCKEDHYNLKIITSYHNLRIINGKLNNVTRIQ